MINNIDQIYHKATRKREDKINAIVYPYDGLFEYLISQLDFFGTLYTSKDFLRHEWASDDWDDKVTMIKDASKIKEPVDLVIANNRQSQAIHAGGVAEVLHVPLVIIDHETPAEGSRTGMIKYVNKSMPSSAKFFHTSYTIGESWHSDGDLLPYPIKMEEEISVKNRDMILVGDYAVEDLDLIETFKSKFPGIHTAGYNQNTDPFISVEYLLQNLEYYDFCLTAALPAKPPIFQMLAASKGCVVMTNPTPWINDIFTHNENAIFYDSIDELESLVKELKDDKERVKKIQINAMDHIWGKFNFDVVQDFWRSHLTEITERIYIR